MIINKFLKSFLISGSLFLALNANSSENEYKKIDQRKIDISITGFNAIRFSQKSIIQFPYNLDSCITNNENFEIKNIAEKNGFFSSITISRIPMKNSENNHEENALITCRNDKMIWKTFAISSIPNNMHEFSIYYVTDKNENIVLKNIVPNTVNYHFNPTTEDLNNAGYKDIKVSELSKKSLNK